MSPSGRDGPAAPKRYRALALQYLQTCICQQQTSGPFMGRPNGGNYADDYVAVRRPGCIRSGAPAPCRWGHPFATSSPDSPAFFIQCSSFRHREAWPQGDQRPLGASHRCTVRPRPRPRPASFLFSCPDRGRRRLRLGFGDLVGAHPPQSFPPPSSLLGPFRSFTNPLHTHARSLASVRNHTMSPLPAPLEISIIGAFLRSPPPPPESIAPHVFTPPLPNTPLPHSLPLPNFFSYM